MKILVTGADGMLGSDLCPMLEDSGFEVIETTINELDITNELNVHSVISDVKPDYVIHCAAYTNVDKAEEERETATLVNATGTQYIAQACKKNDCTLVYISTDYVFDGNKETPYETNDKTSPINLYGLSKLQGEQAIQKICNRYYILRTSWLYGHHGKNFVETMISIAQNPEVKVVDDQTGCPTWTVDLADAIISVIDEDKEYGIYHACGSGSTSWYGFAREIYTQMNLSVNLVPCRTKDYPRPAKRPQYSVMNNNGLLRNWDDALREYLKLRID